MYRRLLVLGVLLALLLPAACNDPNDKYTPEQRSAAADQRVSAFLTVTKQLGIKARVIGSIGPGYYGWFTGALVDPGVHAQFTIEGDPQQYEMAKRAWDVLQHGGSAEQAYAEAVKVAGQSHAPPGSMPAEDGGNEGATIDDRVSAGHEEPTGAG